MNSMRRCILCPHPGDPGEAPARVNGVENSYSLLRIIFNVIVIIINNIIIVIIMAITIVIKMIKLLF